MANRNVYGIIVSLIVGVALGWWLGSLNREVEVREEVRYVESPPITQVIEKPVPIKTDPITIEKIVTLHEEVVIPADTASIIADYLQRREYDLDFSSDTTGVFKVNAIVEANHLASATATVKPLVREVERVVEVQPRKFRPYIGGGVGIGTQLSASVTLGALIKNSHMLSAGYQRIGNGNYITINYGYVFGDKRDNK